MLVSLLTRPLNRHQLLLDVRLNLGDTRKLVQGARDVLGTAVACHGHGEERLFQVSSVRICLFGWLRHGEVS